MVNVRITDGGGAGLAAARRGCGRGDRIGGVPVLGTLEQVGDRLYAAAGPANSTAAFSPGSSSRPRMPSAPA